MVSPTPDHRALRIRYEAFGRFASAVNHARSLDALGAAIASHLKYAVDLVAVRVTVFHANTWLTFDCQQGRCEVRRDKRDAMTSFERERAARTAIEILSADEAQVDPALASAEILGQGARFMSLVSRHGEHSSVCMVIVSRARERPGYMDAAMAEMANDLIETKTSQLLLVEALEKRNLQLDSAIRAAQAANRAKSQLLAMVSHDLRTPLTGIIGMAGVLAASDMNTEQQACCDSILNSGEHLLMLIEDLLNHAAAEAGRLTVDRHPFELRRCLDDAIEAVAAQARNKGLEVTALVDDALPQRLVGDPVRLRQVLVNLLGNAIKFTEIGEVTIEAERADLAPQTTEDDPALGVVLRVRDTGIGLSGDQMAHIFEPFAQAGISARQRYGGTGLGLSICKLLVEAMGGEIAVDSESGVGTIFTVRLPMTVDADDASVVDSQDDTALAGLHVLIVAGADGLRRMLVELCARWHMEPAPFPAMEAAVAELDAGKHFDVAIIDAGALESHDWQDPSACRQDPGDGGDSELTRWWKRVSQSPPAVLLHDGRVLVSRPQLASDRLVPLAKPVRRSRLRRAIALVLPSRARVSAMPIARDLATLLPLRILVVDDVAINRRLMTVVLEQLGYSIDTADNGHRAVEMAALCPYDLIFMDVQLPELDGLEATRRIRARSSSMHARIIAMTAHARPSEVTACTAAGMDDYMSKPMRPSDIQSKLQHWGTVICAARDVDPRPQQ